MSPIAHRGTLGKYVCNDNKSTMGWVFFAFFVLPFVRVHHRFPPAATLGKWSLNSGIYYAGAASCVGAVCANSTSQHLCGIRQEQPVLAVSLVMLDFVLTNWNNLQSQPSGEGCGPESAWSNIKSTSSPRPPKWSIKRKLSDCGHLLHPSSRWLESSVTADNHLHRAKHLSTAVTLFQLFFSVMKWPRL